MGYTRNQMIAKITGTIAMREHDEFLSEQSIEIGEVNGFHFPY